MSRDFLKNYPVTRPPEPGTALPHSPSAPYLYLTYFRT